MTEAKLQWSRSLPDGVIIVVRGEEIEDFILDVEAMKSRFGLSIFTPANTPEYKGTATVEPSSAPQTISSEPTREPDITEFKHCEMHDALMKERHGKNGAIFYSHARKVGEDWEYCSGYGWGVKKPKDEESYGIEGIDAAK